IMCVLHSFLLYLNHGLLKQKNNNNNMRLAYSFLFLLLFLLLLFFFFLLPFFGTFCVSYIFFFIFILLLRSSHSLANIIILPSYFCICDCYSLLFCIIIQILFNSFFLAKFERRMLKLCKI